VSDGPDEADDDPVCEESAVCGAASR